MNLTEIFIPLGICVALPVLIVWLLTRAKINAENKRTLVLLEAIKANNNIDTEALIKAFQTPKSPFQNMMRKFTWGIVLSLLGIGFLVWCIIGACNMSKEDSNVFEMLFGNIFLTICCLGIGCGLLISFFVNKKLLKDPEFHKINLLKK